MDDGIIAGTFRTATISLNKLYLEQLTTPEMALHLPDHQWMLYRWKKVCFAI